MHSTLRPVNGESSHFSFPYRVSIFLALLLFLTNFSIGAFAQATIWYVTELGGFPEHDGFSWEGASSDLQAIIYKSESGDQIWVAGGTYPISQFADGLQIKEGVKIYGGFAGNEATLSQRNLKIPENTSTINGGGSHNYTIYNFNATDGGGLTNATLLDGFTITGGKKAGIYNYQSSPSLANLTIKGNGLVNGEGGVLNFKSNPLFTNVTIVGNTGGSAFGNSESSPTLINCAIFDNTVSTAAVIDINSFPLFINCTIAAEKVPHPDVVAFYSRSNSVVKIRNSVIYVYLSAANQDASSSLDIQDSRVYTKVTSDQIGGTPYLNNDTPLFEDPGAGNYRLQQCSQLVNKGSNAYYASGQTPDISNISTDLDGNLRFFGSGTVDIGAYEYQGDRAPSVPGIRFVKAGGTGSGDSWACASGSLQAAIKAASSGEQVWVAGGTYTVTGSESFIMKEGVKIYGGFAGTEASLADRNLSLPTNKSILQGSNSPVIFNNNTSPALTKAAVLDGFTITGGSIGVYNLNASPMLVNLIITGANGFGMFNTGSSPIVTNCAIFGNSGISGIYNTASSPVITNCTIANNAKPPVSAGIANDQNSAPVIRNSIIYGNINGVFNTNGSTATVENSIVDAVQTEDPTQPQHVDIDPLFVDAAAGDYRLQLCSPALNKGSNTYYAIGQTPDLSAVVTDLGSNSRFFNNGIVDIGAYEYQGNPPAAGIAGVWYVKPGGNGLGKGWDCPLGDLQLAINSAASGEQVWVAGGTYSPGDGPRYSMKEGVKIYGGFAGNETSLSQRDLSITANKSILNANNGPGVLINSVPLTNAAVLDGFTITGVNNGPAVQNNSGSSPKYVNLTITGNQATGMYIYDSSPVLINCTFSGNNSSNFGGGLLISQASPTLINCLIADNTATNNGGGLLISGSTASIINCTIVGNTASGLGGGIYNEGNVSPKLYNSIVNGNNTGISDPGSILDIQYSLVQKDPIPGRPAPTNIDPLFVDAANGNYRLQPCSPVVNAGFDYFKSGLTPDLSGITTDLDNKSRLREHIVDLGAYEVRGTTRALATDQDEASANITRDYVLTSFNSDCRLVAYINPSGVVNGLNAVSGPISAKVWIASSQPAYFVKRHYQITPGNNAATATAKLTLFFTQQEFDDFNAVNTLKLPLNATDADNYKANLRIEKHPGYTTDGTGLPNSYVGTVSTFKPSDANGQVQWNADEEYWEVTFDVTGFSGFFVKTTESALPLNLISFTATKEAGGNLLQWSTSSEVNTDNFEIQSSGDAKKFVKIATVNAGGSGDHQYAYNDQSVYRDNVYYRLKMSDRATNGVNGTFTFSKIISLPGEDDFAAIYPNPAGETVTFQVNNALLSTKAILYDMTGRRIQNITITGNKQQIQTKSLPSGLYILKFADGTLERFMKD